MKTTKTLLQILAAVLIAMMCLCLAACGSDSGADGDGEDDMEMTYKAEQLEEGTPLGTFTSVDLNGNEVSDSIFADKDVTVLNVWATYCDPCIGEMPDLSKWAGELPDNVQIVGVVLDAQEGDEELADIAKSICDDNGVGFTNILINESMSDMLETVEAVPTTYILDSEGRTVCTPVIGADINSYKREVADYLEKIGK